VPPGPHSPTVHATTTEPGITSTKTGEHTASSTEGTSTITSGLRCYHQCPTREECNCYCQGHVGEFQMMSSTTGMTNSTLRLDYVTTVRHKSQRRSHHQYPKQRRRRLLQVRTPCRNHGKQRRVRWHGINYTHPLNGHFNKTSLVATGTGKPLGECTLASPSRTTAA
jgi:hypothetical protein